MPVYQQKDSYLLLIKKLRRNHQVCANDAPATRQPTGSSFIELSITAIVLIVVALVCVDIGMIAWGTSRNDQACYDACRAAADGTDSADALKRAQAASSSNTSESASPSPTIKP